MMPTAGWEQAGRCDGQGYLPANLCAKGKTPEPPLGDTEVCSLLRHYTGVSVVRIHLPTQETQAHPPGQRDPLEKGMAT